MADKFSWKPSNGFEREVVDLQPDFIFRELSNSNLPPTLSHRITHSEHASCKKESKYIPSNDIAKLRDISKEQKIVDENPLGVQASPTDWNDIANIEHELVSMMRANGMGPCFDSAFNSEQTFATYPIDDTVKVVWNGRKRMPIFLGEEFFKFRPSSPGSN